MGYTTEHRSRIPKVCVCLVQDNFLTQHVLEPTRAAREFDIVLSSQKEFVDNVVIQDPLDSSDHNQLHFNIRIKSDKTKVKTINEGRILGKVTIRKLGKVYHIYTGMTN